MPPISRRNELCPCGSGKKFKKCCGAGDDRSGFAPVLLPKPSRPPLKNEDQEEELD